MNKIKKGFKVIDQFSANTGSSCIRNSLNYWKGKKTYRKLNCGGLAVFDTLLNAKNFLYDTYFLDYLDIWRCEYKPAKGIAEKEMFYEFTVYPHKLKVFNIYSRKSNIAVKNFSPEFYEDFKKFINDGEVFFPAGTRLARWVKLIKPITSDFQKPKTL